MASNQIGTSNQIGSTEARPTQERAQTPPLFLEAVQLKLKLAAVLGHMGLRTTLR